MGIDITQKSRFIKTDTNTGGATEHITLKEAIESAIKEISTSNKVIIDTPIVEVTATQDTKDSLADKVLTLTGGKYTVYRDGDVFSNHIQEKECIESAIDAMTEYPDSTVTYNQAEVRVELKPKIVKPKPEESRLHFEMQDVDDLGILPIKLTYTKEDGSVVTIYDNPRYEFRLDYTEPVYGKSTSHSIHWGRRGGIERYIQPQTNTMFFKIKNMDLMFSCKFTIDNNTILLERNFYNNEDIEINTSVFNFNNNVSYKKLHNSFDFGIYEEENLGYFLSKKKFIKGQNFHKDIENKDFCLDSFFDTMEELETKIPEIYSKFYPQQFNWEDKRPVGRVFWAQAHQRSEKNPCGLFNNSDVNIFDETELFAAVDSWANRIISSLKAANAQGLMHWDPEGYEFNHLKYQGDPRPHVTRPEVVKAIKRLHKAVQDAGFWTGVCIRPGVVHVNWDNSSAWRDMKDDRAQTLIDITTYIKEELGCKAAYIDSFGSVGGSEDYEEMTRLRKAHPEFLFSIEHEEPHFYPQTWGYGVGNGADMWGATTYRPWGPTMKFFPYATMMILPNLNLTVEENKRLLIDTSLKNGQVLLFDAWWGNFGSYMGAIYNQYLEETDQD